MEIKQHLGQSTMLSLLAGRVDGQHVVDCTIHSVQGGCHLGHVGHFPTTMKVAQKKAQAR